MSGLEEWLPVYLHLCTLDLDLRGDWLRQDLLGVEDDEAIPASGVPHGDSVPLGGEVGVGAHPLVLSVSALSDLMVLGDGFV